MLHKLSISERFLRIKGIFLCCKPQLAERLGLTPATISHHMDTAAEQAFADRARGHKNYLFRLRTVYPACGGGSFGRNHLTHQTIICKGACPSNVKSLHLRGRSFSYTREQIDAIV